MIREEAVPFPKWISVFAPMVGASPVPIPIALGSTQASLAGPVNCFRSAIGMQSFVPTAPLTGCPCPNPSASTLPMFLRWQLLYAGPPISLIPFSHPPSIPCSQSESKGIPRSPCPAVPASTHSPPIPIAFPPPFHDAPRSVRCICRIMDTPMNHDTR